MLTAGVVIVGGLGYGVLAGALWVRETIRSQDAAQAVSQQTTAYPVPTDCVTENLDVSVSAPLEVSVGAGMTMEITVTNRGTDACLFDAGTQSIGAVITSGTDTVWVSTACPYGLNSRRLLVDAGDSASTVLTWDGRSTDPACLGLPTPESEPTEEPAPEQTPTEQTPTEETGDPAAEASEGTTSEPTEAAPVTDPRVAQAGTYRLRIQVAGNDVTDDQIFLVT